MTAGGMMERRFASSSEPQGYGLPVQHRRTQDTLQALSAKQVLLSDSLALTEQLYRSIAGQRKTHAAAEPLWHASTYF